MKQSSTDVNKILSKVQLYRYSNNILKYKKNPVSKSIVTLKMEKNMIYSHFEETPS